MDLNTVRHDSPVCGKYIYLDTAAASAPTQKNINSVINYLQRSCDEGLYMPQFRKETYQHVDDVRGQVAEFLNAQANEIAFVKNGSEAISVIAQGIEWQAGDEVIVSGFEILSNLSPWLRLRDRKGIKVIIASPDDDGVLNVDDIAALISSKTKLITFSHLSNVTGALQPIQAICDLAKSKGIQTLICAAQSLGMIPLDVKKLGCDYLAACGRKSLRAIEGSGILYVRQEHIEHLEPCLVGWWNSRYDSATGVLTLESTARRFEAGCPIIPAIISTGEAIGYAQSMGIDNIAKRVHELTAFCVDKLTSIPGAQLYGPRNINDRMAIITFNINGIDAHDMVLNLEKHGVIIEAGHFMADAIMRKYNISKMARISLHYFNSEDDINKVITLIREML